MILLDFQEMALEIGVDGANSEEVGRDRVAESRGDAVHLVLALQTAVVGVLGEAVVNHRPIDVDRLGRPVSDSAIAGKDGGGWGLTC